VDIKKLYRTTLRHVDYIRSICVCCRYWRAASSYTLT